MALTNFGIISLVLNVLLIAITVYLLSKLMQQQQKIKSLVNELGSDSLEHYLQEIKKRGFDFTLKPKKASKK